MMLPSNQIQSMDDFSGFGTPKNGQFFGPRQVSASVSLCLAPLSKPGHPATGSLESQIWDESGVPTDSAKVV